MGLRLLDEAALTAFGSRDPERVLVRRSHDVGSDDVRVDRFRHPRLGPPRSIEFFTGWDGESLYLAQGIMLVDDDGFHCYTTLIGFIDINFTIPAFLGFRAPVEGQLQALEDRRSIARFSYRGSDVQRRRELSGGHRVGAGQGRVCRRSRLRCPTARSLTRPAHYPRTATSSFSSRTWRRNITSFLYSRSAGRGLDGGPSPTPAKPASPTIYFVNGNCAPNVIPKSIEQTGNGYLITAKAYDPDETAKVKFYWNRDNTTFSGICIGEVDENDGKLTFDWDARQRSALQERLRLRGDPGWGQPTPARLLRREAYGRHDEARQAPHAEVQGGQGTPSASRPSCATRRMSKTMRGLLQRRSQREGSGPTPSTSR